MIDTDTKVRRNPSVVARDLAEGEGGVLLHLDSGQYHGVNPIGLAIWELLDHERTVGQVTAALRDRVDEPPADLESDVVQFLREVAERDLVAVAR
jgi:hypothetical protein